MKYVAVLFLALTATALAQQPEASPLPTTNPSCATQARVVYEPPKDLITRTARGLEELAVRQPSASMSPAQYNRDLQLLIAVGEDGLVRDVKFSQSSGNRLLDRAARNWAFGLMFAPLDCGEAYQYEVALPVSVFARGGA